MNRLQAKEEIVSIVKQKCKKFKSRATLKMVNETIIEVKKIE